MGLGHDNEDDDEGDSVRWKKVEIDVEWKYFEVLMKIRDRMNNMEKIVIISVWIEK